MLLRISFLCLITIITVIELGQSAYGDMGMSKYWSYEKFLEVHPDEKIIAENFAVRVREKGQPRGTLAKPVHVAMIYPGKEASDYWYRSASSFEARMRELNLPYEIRPFFSKQGKNALRVQEKQIAEALKGDPDYLIFTLDAFRHRIIIERILARGRPKLILQNITTPVRAWGQNQPFLYVGFDHSLGSAMLADKFLELFPEPVSYALFYGSRGYVSSMRGGGFKKNILKRGDVKLIDAYYVGFNRENAKKAALSLFENEKSVPFIYACSTAIALGVIDAAKEMGRLAEVKVNGWGGGSSELDAIEKGELDFTVMRMNDDNGVAMADAIALDGEGRSDEVPTVYSGDMVLVEIGSDVEKLKKRAFRYSDHWQTKTDVVSVFHGMKPK